MTFLLRVGDPNTTVFSDFYRLPNELPLMGLYPELCGAAESLEEISGYLLSNFLDRTISRVPRLAS
jgi:hypothetical protein